MKQYGTRIGIALAVCLSILFVTSGCTKSKTIIVEKPPPKYIPPPPAKKGPPPWAPAHGYRAKHQYHYYPSSHVYYDTGRNLYFYLEGDTWRFGASLPAGIKLEVGDHVTLEMDTDKPYEFHTDVVKKYPPGQLKKKNKVKGQKKGKEKIKKKGKGKDK
jgi:hypothetical protein